MKMNISPVEGFNPDTIGVGDRRFKYQDLEIAMKQPGRWFNVGYMTEGAYRNLRMGHTKVPGDKTKWKFAQDLKNVDPENKERFFVYAKYVN